MRFGRPRTLEAVAICRMKADGQSPTQIARRLGISCLLVCIVLCRFTPRPAEHTLPKAKQGMIDILARSWDGSGSHNHGLSKRTPSLTFHLDGLDSHEGTSVYSTLGASLSSWASSRSTRKP